MKKVVFTLLLLVILIPMQAQTSQEIYQFLRLPVSAHAAALGGDNITLIEDDAPLMFNNPALLGSVSDKTLNLNYMNYMSGVNYGSASFTRIIREATTIAAGVQFINYGRMRQTDENGVQIGEFSANEIAFSGVFSYELSERFIGGITAKLITSYFGSYNSLAMGVDLGVNYYDPDRQISVSAVAKNLGGQLKAYNDNYEKMPLDLQFGISKRFERMPLRFSATFVDLNHWHYAFVNHVTAGVDVLLSDRIYVAAGYNFRRTHEMKIAVSDGSSSHGAGLSLGAGLQLEHFKLHLAYGKYHVSSSSLIMNVSYSL